ncbi:Hsp33 family molecular chaperone HslO [Dongia rigui]|uniref:Hsp33 family molecular chaperone HslO n=1 Tax=Dongia rigui TaxID=940149 RepID=A0ABU5DYP2_9PROT|nr:Hsp33 family molecular chaperone HslO [Dongia rigui]MDY0872447.1 Hsp33 family molecular chaperone HslO [Dongia rigui]
MEPSSITPPISDFVQPFQIEGHGVRGRLVRLDGVASEIIAKHAYPEPVAHLLTEMMALAAVLAATLKYEGVFTLQAKGNGAVRVLVADVTSGGAVRGYAQFDKDAVAAIPAASANLMRLTGGGYLAFTVDQGEHAERYQGIVELEGQSLVDCIHHYFQQSEQLQAAFKLAIENHPGGWRAGAIMLQRLPSQGGHHRPEGGGWTPDGSKPHDWQGGEGSSDIDGEEAEDAWRRAVVLMASAQDKELLGPETGINDLLYRLFHEDGVRVFTGHALKAQCRCSRHRVENVLRSLGKEELDDLAVDGALIVTCEFCNSEYRFARSDVKPPVD